MLPLEENGIMISRNRRRRRYLGPATRNKLLRVMTALRSRHRVGDLGIRRRGIQGIITVIRGQNHNHFMGSLK